MIIALPTLHVRPSAQAVPLAAGCLAAALPPALQAGVRLLDGFPADSLETLQGRILDLRPQLVAFPLYLWNRERVLQLARNLRQARPGLLLAAGGPEVAADPNAVLREGALDLVIRGEGERTFAELVARLAAGHPWQDVAGLSWRTAAGFGSSPDRPVVAALDQLPSPWLSGLLRPTAAGGVLWETSRGCPFHCDFCYDARGSRGVRHLGEARLAAELTRFVELGVRQVWVLDSTFNYPPERGKALLRLIARLAPQVHFHLEAKADFLDRETARLLARIPCSLQIGLQSADPAVLKRIHRSHDAQQFSSRIHQLAAEGITYGLDLIYGLPGDSHAGFCRSVDIALRLQPNHLDLFPLAVLPGTPLHQNRESFGLHAQPAPPYLIEESASYSAADLAASRELAGATDLFYNAGRAVAFFPALLKATGLAPSELLTRFGRWVKTRPGSTPERLADPTAWSSQEIVALQEDFSRQLLHDCGRDDLVSAALDLLHYHFHYAETLLGPETRPAPAKQLRNRPLWTTPWRRGPGVRLVPFRYEILDLLEMEEVDLDQFAALFRPVGSVAIFLRRGPEVMCESLEEDFLKLLQGSDGRRTPAEIFAGSIGRVEGEEIVEFALAEGFLQPPEKPKARTAPYLRSKSTRPR